MDLGSTEFSNIISYVSLIVSGTIAVFYIRDRSHAKYTIENEYSNQLLSWHGAVVDVLTALCDCSNTEDEENKRPLLIKLSSLIEQGRFFFPNILPNNYGVEKPPAYRGYRNIALDFLVASYNLHHKPSNDQTKRQAAHLQRLFTSVVFEVVRPADRLLTIRKLTDKYFVKDLSIRDLEAPDQIDLVRHMWERPK